MIKFNWAELNLHSDCNLSAILVLTYALTKGYNTKLAWNAKELREKLFINNIPSRLFMKGFLTSNKYGGIITKYRCKDPQSYFKNSNFLFYLCSLQAKINYLYLLSQRRMNDLDNYVLEDRVPEKYWDNLLIFRDQRKLYFSPEIALINSDHRSTNRKRRQ